MGEITSSELKKAAKIYKMILNAMTKAYELGDILESKGFPEKNKEIKRAMVGLYEANQVITGIGKIGNPNNQGTLQQDN